MTDDKKDRKEDLLDLGIPVDSTEPGEIQEEPQDEFEVYRSLGYLSTGDVLTETKLSKGELFYLLNTGFPLVEPVQVPYEAFDQQVRAYLFSTRDVYVLKLIKNMKKKYSLQRLRGIFSQIELYSLVKTKLSSILSESSEEIDRLPSDTFQNWYKEREKETVFQVSREYYSKKIAEETAEKMARKTLKEWKFIKGNTFELLWEIYKQGGYNLIEELELNEDIDRKISLENDEIPF